MQLRNSIMLPPHGLLTGALFGSESDVRRNLAYWKVRAASGAGWICGLNGFVGNSVIVPGFEPAGLGATRRGVFRIPQFLQNAGRYAEIICEQGAYASAQLIMQGGTPHSPSGLMANYTKNQVPHVLTRDEIQWFVGECAYSAAQSEAAGLDGVEVHANHEDLVQLFLSPATNHRHDDYGGDLTGRTRFLVEILTEIRRLTTAGFSLGVRLNMDEFFDGGYGVDGGLEIAGLLEQTAMIDYVHCVVGNNWGAPSYIQTHDYPVAGWAQTSARFKAELTLPVVYSGRVSTAAAAAQVIDGGQADVVGMARAMFADGDLVAKARAGSPEEIRPCIGTNECLHRVVVEGLRFGCSVNPRAGRESKPPLPAAVQLKRILVAGAGPAGLELAALLAERGHDVAEWEREAVLGGQLRIASRAAENGAYAEFVAFQGRRLTNLGVEVRTGQEATADRVRAAGFDVLAVATGANARCPDLPGVELPYVVQGRDVLLGTAEVGQRVVVIAMEDHMQPLTIAGYLANQDRQVTVVYPTPAIAPLVGKYSIGAPLARLASAGAAIRVMERVTGIQAGRVATRNVYSGTPGEITDVDSVVLACGGVSETNLYTALQRELREVHLLGDAYAPRRISFATRQAYELAARI